MGASHLVKTKQTMTDELPTGSQFLFWGNRATSTLDGIVRQTKHSSSITAAATLFGPSKAAKFEETKDMDGS